MAAPPPPESSGNWGHCDTNQQKENFLEDLESFSLPFKGEGLGWSMEISNPQADICHLPSCGRLTYKDIRILILRTHEYYLIWQNRLHRCDLVKDPEMGRLSCFSFFLGGGGRLSWIIQLGSKYNHKCPHKREAEDHCPQRQCGH